jgi:hypothetical protein
MKKYLVRVRSTQNGLQSVLLFDPTATIEFLSYEEGTEEYEVITPFDLDRILDTSPEVLSYISEEITP